MEKEKKRPIHPEAKDLAIHLVKFFNVAFGRNIGKIRPEGSDEFLYHVSEALWDKYSNDEIRIAFWIARCLTGNAAWLSEQLRSGSVLPHVVLRHKGRLNNQTGKEAKRWLDDLIARAGEANQVMMKSLFGTLPESMHDEERDLLARMGMELEFGD